MRQALRQFLALGATVGCFAPVPAEGFQQTQTCFGNGIFRCEPGEVAKGAFWPATLEESLVPDSTALPQYAVHPFGGRSLEGEEEDEMSERLLGEILAGFDAWNEVECSGLILEYIGSTEVTAQESGPTSNRQDEDGKPCRASDQDCLMASTSTSLNLCGPLDPPVCDSVNLVILRPDNWPTQYASPTAFAITSVNVNRATGQIVDADMEFNVERQDLGIREVAERPDDVVDIRNVTTHEAGHFLGLDHSENEEATMWRSSGPGEISKRDLSPDDIDGVCEIYPYVEPTRPPVAADEGYCAVVRSGDDPTIPWVAIVVAFWMLRRRRR